MLLTREEFEENNSWMPYEDFEKVLNHPLVEQLINDELSNTAKKIQEGMDKKEYYKHEDPHYTQIDVELLSAEVNKRIKNMEKAMEENPEYRDYMQWSKLMDEKHSIESKINFMNEENENSNSLNSALGSQVFMGKQYQSELEDLNNQLQKVNDALEQCTYGSGVNGVNENTAKYSK